MSNKGNLQRKVGIVVIGVGARLRGLLHLLTHLHADLIELKALCDSSNEAIEEAQRSLQIKVPAFNDYNQMLKIVEDVDWVLIGSKNCEHMEHCIAAFGAGKNVFCEKPLAISLDQCGQIMRAHRKSGKLFATGFVLRHAPLYVKLHAMINEGVIGRLISVEANELLSPAHGGYIMRNWRRFKGESGPHILVCEINFVL